MKFHALVLDQALNLVIAKINLLRGGAVAAGSIVMCMHVHRPLPTTTAEAKGQPHQNPSSYLSLMSTQSCLHPNPRRRGKKKNHLHARSHVTYTPGVPPWSLSLPPHRPL